jgi:cathepsin L
MTRNILLGLPLMFLFISWGANAQDKPQPPFTPQPPTYRVGKTSVAEISIPTVAATIVPPDLSLQAQAQTKLAVSIASTAEAAVLGARSDEVFLEGCDPNATRFDWREKQAVTPIKNQGECGDCFIFASTGAFESSWYLQNHKTISVSEQQLLDCAKAGGCGGGWHGNVFNFLKSTGVASDSNIPYVGHQNATCSSTDHPYTVINWSYVDSSGSMASPAAIKRAMCLHGPTVSAVYATRPFLQYVGGVFNEFAEGSGASIVNHDVLIVGWDDTRDAWLIKNSWGTADWGEQGFMWIRYRSNYIGFGAAWVDAIKLPTEANTSTEVRTVQDKVKALNESNAVEISKSFNFPKDTMFRALGIK